MRGWKRVEKMEDGLSFLLVCYEKWEEKSIDYLHMGQPFFNLPKWEETRRENVIYK